MAVIPHNVRVVVLLAWVIVTRLIKDPDMSEPSGPYYSVATTSYLSIRGTKS